MSLARTIETMLAAGCSAEQLSAVVRAHEDHVEKVAAEKRAKAAALKRKQREDAKRLAEIASTEASVSTNVHRTSQDIDGQSETSLDSGGHCRTDLPEVSPKDNISNPLPTPPSSLRSVNSRGRNADPVFERFWMIFPKREGSNPKDPAARKFKTIVALGVDPEAIIASAEAYARSVVGTEPRFIAQAATWLNQGRWKDEHRAPAMGSPARDGPAPRYPPRRSTNGFADLLMEDLNNERHHDDAAKPGSCATDPRGRDAHRDLSDEARAGGATVLDARAVGSNAH